MSAFMPRWLSIFDYYFFHFAISFAGHGKISHYAFAATFHYFIFMMPGCRYFAITLIFQIIRCPPRQSMPIVAFTPAAATRKRGSFVHVLSPYRHCRDTTPNIMSSAAIVCPPMSAITVRHIFADWHVFRHGFIFTLFSDFFRLIFSMPFRCCYRFRLPSEFR
jgi:hypothetical protein